MKKLIKNKHRSAFPLVLIFLLAFSGCDKPPLSSSHGHDHGDHGAHDDHSGEDLTSIELSEQAMKNIDLKIGRVKLGPFTKTVNFPAMIVEQPSTTKTVVATPMTGIVTQVFIHEGEAILPDTLLFKIRLTHEDLVQIQSRFLETLGKLDVENKELERLNSLTQGVVAKKVILEREYAKATLNAILGAQREALQLHGLNKEQISQIETSRKLLKELSIYAPNFLGKSEKFILSKNPVKQVSYTQAKKTEKQEPVYIVQNLQVSKGENLTAGHSLCTLVDYHKLLIEGAAFEHDVTALMKAVDNQWDLTAYREEDNQMIKNLKIQYVSNEVDTDSRAFHFYVSLPNEITRDVTNDEGIRFINWKYKPGERLKLDVPVETWKDKIVVPIDAVAEDGAEYYVFQKKGNIFKKIPVHVEHRDANYAVIENDGSLKLGWKIAFSSAYQLNIALKNKSGGGVDPHAGHTH